MSRNEEKKEKLPSYVLPYTLVATTLGGLLTYGTNYPVFVVVSIPLGIGAGLIRDRNVVLLRESSADHGSFILKGMVLYKLGLPLLLLTGFGILALASKR